MVCDSLNSTLRLKGWIVNRSLTWPVETNFIKIFNSFRKGNQRSKAFKVASIRKTPKTAYMPTWNPQITEEFDPQTFHKVHKKT